MSDLIGTDTTYGNFANWIMLEFVAQDRNRPLDMFTHFHYTNVVHLVATAFANILCTLHIDHIGIQ